MCSFFLDLLANSLGVNIFCYINEDAYNSIYYFQNLDSNISQAQTTDIPINGANEQTRDIPINGGGETQEESNNLPNIQPSILTSTKHFYKFVVNKTRRRLY